MWVRVKTDAEAVRKLCAGDGEEQDYAVGWEQGMDETLGKPFPVGVVSRAYRKSPVVGLSVPNGLVAIAGGRYPDLRVVLSPRGARARVRTEPRRNDRAGKSSRAESARTGSGVTRRARRRIKYPPRREDDFPVDGTRLQTPAPASLPSRAHMGSPVCISNFFLSSTTNRQSSLVSSSLKFLLEHVDGLPGHAAHEHVLVVEVPPVQPAALRRRSRLNLHRHGLARRAPCPPACGSAPSTRFCQCR